MTQPTIDNFDHLKSITCCEDLLNVGPVKSVGYLPLSTIGSDQNAHDFIRWAESTGKSWAVFKEGHCDIGNGALFIYDEPTLSKLLIDNEKDLIAGELPVDPVEFINKLATYYIHNSNPAYHVVLKAFNWKD